MMIMTQATFIELIQDETPLLGDLSNLYEEIPRTECKRRASCCRMLPDATLIETVAALRKVSCLPTGDKLATLKRIIHYFFVNPVEMTACPFLSGQDCLIYENRFFGCRAYGLWSNAHYEKVSAQDRETRSYLQEQWENIGISLPDGVISFRQPYCRDVKTLNCEPIDDSGLASTSERIESLSSSFSQWHGTFQNTYFSDMGFLLAAVAMGISEAIQTKHDIVKAILLRGDRTQLDGIMSDFSDIL